MPIQASTAFQIGSVTKQFTTAAVLQLVDAGHLNLDRAVNEVLPAYGFDSRITVRVLLNQTSGLYAAGALWSNVVDLAAWNNALTNSTIIPASLFSLTVTPADVPISSQSAPSQYGMGWLRTTQLGRPFVLHDGKTASYSAFNGMFLDNGFSIALATNVALPNGASFESTATTLIGAVCGTPALAGVC